VLAVGPPLLLAPLFLGPEPSTFLLLVVLGYAALAAERFSGRAAWLAGGAYVGYMALVYVASGDRSIGLVMLTLPGFVAGTALRWRRDTAEALADRGRELELERELFTELTVRNERARIASELHDIVGLRAAGPGRPAATGRPARRRRGRELGPVAARGGGHPGGPRRAARDVPPRGGA
jgi:hypothetical protein